MNENEAIVTISDMVNALNAVHIILNQIQDDCYEVSSWLKSINTDYKKPDLHADEMDWYDSITQRIAREVNRDEKNLTPRQEAQKERIENSPVIKPDGEFIF